MTRTSTRVIRRTLGAALAVGLAAAFPAAAGAQSLDDPVNQWLPSSDGAAWTYQWSNTGYQPTPIRETYSVTGRDGAAFTVNWIEQDLPPGQAPAAGFVNLSRTDGGLVNASYQSTPAPAQYPVLCATATRCGNSLAGTMFLALWGSRSAALAEPLTQGLQWTARGGAEDDVSSSNRYAGTERVVVPAFPQGIAAVRIDSDVVQTGAIGDPFGTGSRSVWWVYGVGPVKVVLRHAGGETSTSELQSTTLVPLPAPPVTGLFPLREGGTAVFRWRNNRRMKAWSRQRFTTSGVLNNTGRIDVESVSGPIEVDGSYAFSTRLSGTRLLTSRLDADEVPGPLSRRLGPGEGANWERRFLTPYDLMTYGFGPVLPAYPRKGQQWRSAVDSRDFRNYAVVGESRVLGVRTLRTARLGRLRTTVVRSQLRQPGQPFGSGTRTMWFAPRRGLVQLVFRHRDGSVSRVERVR